MSVIAKLRYVSVETLFSETLRQNIQKLFYFLLEENKTKYY